MLYLSPLFGKTCQYHSFYGPSYALFVYREKFSDLAHSMGNFVLTSKTYFLLIFISMIDIIVDELLRHNGKIFKRSPNLTMHTMDQKIVKFIDTMWFSCYDKYQTCPRKEFAP